MSESGTSRQLEIVQAGLEAQIAPVAKYFKENTAMIVGQLMCDKGEGKHWITSDSHYKTKDRIGEGFDLKIERNVRIGLLFKDVLDTVWVGDNGKIKSVNRLIKESGQYLGKGGPNHKSELEIMNTFGKYLSEYNSWH